MKIADRPRVQGLVLSRQDKISANQVMIRQIALLSPFELKVLRNRCIKDIQQRIELKLKAPSLFSNDSRDRYIAVAIRVLLKK